MSLPIILDQIDSTLGWVRDRDGVLYSPLMKHIGNFIVTATSPTQDDTIMSMVMDDTHIYCAINNVNRIVKFLKTDLSVIAISPILTAVSSGYYMKIDDTYIYFVCHSHPQYSIIKMLKSDLSVVESSIALSQLTDMTSDETHVYVADFSAKTFIKLLKSDLSVVKTGPAQSYGARRLNSDDTYIYAVLDTSNTIIKISKSDLSLVKSSSTQFTSASTMVMDHTHLYLVRGGSINTVTKILKSDLSVVAISPAQSAGFNSLAMDDVYIYGSFNVSNTNTIITMLKSDLSVVVSGSSPTKDATSILLDNAYIYYVNNTDKRVGKILTIFDITGYIKEDM